MEGDHTMTTTARPQTTAPVTTLGVTDPAAIATFLKGVPLDDAFWRRVHHRCDHCHVTGTTAVGALWRISLADDCQELYYLHTRCLRAHKAAHGLQSVEGRIPLRRPATDAPVVPSLRRRQGALSHQGRPSPLGHQADHLPVDAHQDAARRRPSVLPTRDARDARDARPPVAEEASATGGAWRTQTVVDPVDGPLTTLYRPDGRPAAYAAGADDAALLRVAERLNKRTPAVRA